MYVWNYCNELPKYSPTSPSSLYLWSDKASPHRHFPNIERQLGIVSELEGPGVDAGVDVPAPQSYKL